MSAVCAAALAVGLLASPAAVSPAAAETAPTAVAVTGDFDSLIGCSNDWAPDCPQAQMSRRSNDGVWSLTVDLPAGSYNYKAALDSGWLVNYGLHAEPGGANIPLTVPAGGAAVTFLYDEVTHWIIDTINDPIATAAGDAIPAGEYQVKVTLGMSWAVNYGENGTPGGGNIPFTSSTGTFTVPGCTVAVFVEH